MKCEVTPIGLKVYQFNHLLECKKLTHGIFTKHGGLSTGSYSSLNIGLSIQDKDIDVAQNRLRIKQHLNLESIKWTFQVHGDTLQSLTNPEQETNNCQGDGLMTDLKGIGLGIKHADCQAAIFYDPVQHILANIHCGWRGNVLDIYKKTITSMASLYGCRAENILVGISPSLGPQNSEFINYRDEFPEPLHSFQVFPNYFNLWEISRWQLEMCGVLPHHIEIAQICTYEAKEDWYSYRRDKVTGRNATVAALL